MEGKIEKGISTERERGEEERMRGMQRGMGRVRDTDKEKAD
jgi:hypothetical protein